MNITQLKSMPYRLGFIGGSIKSAIGYTHYIASRMDNRFILSAGCFSTDTIINLQTSKQWGLDSSKVYQSWEELLLKEKNSLDAIVVLTPTPEHSEIIIKALELGYPVITEKALSTNSEDAKDIKSVLEEKNGFLAVTYNYSGYPMLRELRHRIENGELGILNSILIEMPQEGFIRTNPDGNSPYPQKWRQTDHFIPSISLDLGTHCHHLISFITGLKPVSVICDQSKYGFIPDVIDDVTAMVRYENNFRANVWFSKSAIGHRNGLKIRLFGSESSAEWVQENPEYLAINRKNGERVALDRSAISSVASDGRYNRFKVGHPSGFIEAFANLYVDISDSLEQYFSKGDINTDYVYGIDHAIEGLKLLEAMQSSVVSNGWVDVNNEIKEANSWKTPLKNISYNY